MNTKSRPDSLELAFFLTQGRQYLLSPWQINALDCSAINKYLITASRHGLSPSETMCGEIDTGKAAKCQGRLCLYWVSVQ